MLHTFRLVALFVVLSAGTAAQAAGQTRCDDGAPWVGLTDNGDSTALSKETVARRLQADLAGQGMVLCDPDQATTAPHATISLQSSPTQVLVAVQFETDGKAESAQHTVELEPIPEDGRPIAVAAIAAELLRTYAPAPARPEIVHADIEDDLDHAIAPASPGAIDVELGMGGTRYGGGQQQWGPDLRGRFWFGGRFAFVGGVSYRFSRPQHAFNGLIDAQSLLVGTGLDFAVVPRQDRLQLVASVFGAGGAITYTPTPDAEARGATRTLPIATAGAALSASYRMTPMWFAGLRLQGMGTLYAAKALDEDRSVTAVSGLGGEAAVFLGANL